MYTASAWHVRTFLAPKVRWFFAINANHVIALATLVSAAATISYVFYARAQWKAMQEQVDAMRDSVIQNGRMTVQAIKQSNSARIGADAARDAAKIADATLKDSQRTFMIEQRPYIIEDSPTFSSLTGNPKAPITLSAGQGIFANVTLRNIGKTPGMKVITYVDLIPYRQTTRNAYIVFLERKFSDMRFKNAVGRKIMRDPNIAKLDPGHDVAPLGSFFASNSDPVVVSPTDFADLIDETPAKAGMYAIYFVGLLSYTDAFSNNYESEFCWFYCGAHPETWHICETHNAIR